MLVAFTVNSETLSWPQRSKAINEWRGLAQFCGSILDVKEEFIKAVQPFDEKKTFGHAAFKESAGLSRPYLTAVCQLGGLSDINVTTSGV